MSTVAADALHRVGYRTARRLLLAGGLLVLAVTAGVMYVRRVDTVEVTAILLFMPIFVALVLGGVPGGLLAGMGASVVYVWMRYPAIDAIGADRFTGLIASRTVAFLAFGLIGGWGSRQLEASLTKLDLYDEVDDATRLGNARSLLHAVDLELARTVRYRTIFSVVAAEIPAEPLADLGRRRRASALRELGRLLRESVRTVDRPAHGTDGERHLVAVLLPETAAEGAGVFAGRLQASLQRFLDDRGAPAPVTVTALSLPGDDEGLAALKEQVAAIERREHPETASTGT